MKGKTNEDGSLNLIYMQDEVDKNLEKMSVMLFVQLQTHMWYTMDLSVLL